MSTCFFASDLHGKNDRYRKLFVEIKKQLPVAVFLGGDLLPHSLYTNPDYDDFIDDFLIPGFQDLKNDLKHRYPDVFLILGNDDARIHETRVIEAESLGIWKYIHMKKCLFMGYRIFGYACVPPSPFLLKDWEKYDVSRYVDPGCVPPGDGYHSVPPPEDVDYTSIVKDLQKLAGNENLSKAVFLFHAPPYDTQLDRAALDGIMIDHVPLDVHVGSIAIKRFILEKQPLLTLHGHIHESTRLTGKWQQILNGTLSFNGSHDGYELSLIKFDLEAPQLAERFLL